MLQSNISGSSVVLFVLADSYEETDFFVLCSTYGLRLKSLLLLNFYTNPLLNLNLNLWLLKNLIVPSYLDSDRLIKSFNSRKAHVLCLCSFWDVFAVSEERDRIYGVGSL